MKKSLSIMIALICVITAGFAATACTDKEKDGVKGVQTYTMEAEYIDLDSVVGAGISSEANGVNMIYGEGTTEQKNMGWSNGYFVGATYSAGLKLDFKFQADAEGKATIILRLGSEIGDITFDPSSLAVKLNGEALSYTNIFVEGSDMDSMVFSDKTITTDASIAKGDNVLTIEVLNNTLRSGQVGAPMVDCVKFKTTSKLTWTDKTDNPGRRGEI